MGNFSRRQRSTSEVRAGRRRADEIATRMGRALRDARTGLLLTQAALADRARLSQTEVSRLERGHGASASIETWATLAAATGRRVAAFLEETPGATLPRDFEHLKRQQLLIAVAASGGWEALPEAPVAVAPPPGVGATRLRSIDVLLRRGDEIAVAEIWDLLDDGGAALRGLDLKCAALAAAHPDATVRGLFILRGTHRNRRLVADLRDLFAARFPGPAAAALRALATADARMPDADALLWSDVPGTRLLPSRIRSDPHRRRDG